MQSNHTSEIELNNIAAIIFDTDGVLTDTASTHAKAWKQLFDEYLKERAKRYKEVFLPFDIDTDYLQEFPGITWHFSPSG